LIGDLPQQKLKTATTAIVAMNLLSRIVPIIVIESSYDIPDGIRLWHPQRSS